MFLRQSTAQAIKFGPFLDSTDGVTEKTALTIAQADRRLSKDGGAYAQSSTTGNATHDEQGNYSTTLSATDTNTVGELKIYVSVSGALPVWEKWYVVEEAVYDAMYAASATGPAQAGDAMDLVANAVDSTSIANNAITAAKIASNAITNAKIAAGAITSTEATTIGTAEIVGPGGISSLSFQANSITAGAIAAAALNGKGDWNIGKTGYSISGTKTTLDALNDLSGADVKTEADAALVGIHLDHLLDVATTSFPGNAGSILGEMIERISTWRFVTEALSQAPSGGGGTDWTAAEREQIRHRIGITGTRTDPGAIDASIWSDDASQLIENSAGLRYTTKALEQAPSGGGGLSSQDVRDAMKLAPTAGAPAAGSIDEELDTINTSTGGLAGAAMRGTDGASTHTAVDVRTEMDNNSTQLAAILTDTGTDIPALIAALNDISPAQVNAEMVDVIFTDVIAELTQGVPAATPTLANAVMLLYMALRNQIDVTAGQKEIHNNAGTVITKKALSDDGTTYSEAEMVSGP